MAEKLDNLDNIAGVDGEDSNSDDKFDDKGKDVEVKEEVPSVTEQEVNGNIPETSVPDVSLEEEIVEEINHGDDNGSLEEFDGEKLEPERPRKDLIPSPASVDEEFMCHLCGHKYKEPRVLSCLHVFCVECLEKQLASKANKIETTDKGRTILECVICDQVTVLGSSGLRSLPLDHVLVNMLDMSMIEKMQVLCTSCKAKEKAVARCMDCANFLGANCVTAHQYMRCFENHKVVLFEDMEEGIVIHKPLYCSNHPSESLKYFCLACQLAVCSECLMVEHQMPAHVCEKISDVEAKTRDKLIHMNGEAKAKVAHCEKTSAMLGESLTDLQLERDNMKGLIEETFISYKAILEKYKDLALERLNTSHKRQVFAVMTMSDNVNKIQERIEDAQKFAERLLAHGNGAELMHMKRYVANQMDAMISQAPNVELTAKVEFITDMNKFENAVKQTFGYFDIREAFKDELQNFHSMEDGLTLGGCGFGPDPTAILSNESGLGSTASGEGADFLAPLPPLPMTGLAGNAGFPNLTSLLERSASRNSSYSPAMSDSGISMDTGSNGSAGQVNLGAMSGAMSGAVADLAKLSGFALTGPNSLSQHGLGGLGNINNLLGLSAGVMNQTNRVMTPTTPEPDLSSLLGALNAQNTQNNSNNLSDLSALLQSSSAGGLGGLSGLSSPTLGQGLLQPSLSMDASLGSATGQPIGSLVANRSRNAMQIRSKFGQLGPGKGQFNSPHGFCLGIDEDIVVADTNNHRIQVFEKSGEFKYQFGIPGRDEGQLWYPRKVAVVRVSGKYVVCDRGNERSRMQIFTKNGHFIKKIAIRYIDIVAGLAINLAGHIVAVDSVSPTVFVISEAGDLIKWFDCSDYMREPSDIAVNGKEYFICDFKGHCVVVFNEEGQFLRRIGCENITNFPNGIDISDAGDVLIGDSHGNRFHVGVFQRDGSLIGEFECPYVKVSRCCGLKITSEGYVVTLAKNNHHVLVLNTLYIT